MGRCRAMAARMPPFAVPSSLVTTSPVTSTLAERLAPARRAFCPVVASITSQVSCGAPGRPLPMTRLILRKLGHQVGLGVQAAGRVDEQHVGLARHRGLHGVVDHRRRIGAACAITSTPMRSPQTPAARARRPGRCRPRRASPSCPSSADARRACRWSSSCRRR